MEHAAFASSPGVRGIVLIDPAAAMECELVTVRLDPRSVLVDDRDEVGEQDPEDVALDAGSSGDRLCRALDRLVRFKESNTIVPLLWNVRASGHPSAKPARMSADEG